jgi:uncharacterized repeat protein (TIGR01451 family)
MGNIGFRAFILRLGRGLWPVALLSLLLPQVSWAGGLGYFDGASSPGTNTGNFTVPAGVAQITVELWAGGGGGGGASNGSAASPAKGGGGAGGQYVKGVLSVVPGTVYNMGGGGGGAGGGESGTVNGDGGNGYDSTFKLNGASVFTLIAKGGQGGKGSANGGFGGLGSAEGGIGDIVYPGGDGSNASASASGAGGGGAGGHGGIADAGGAGKPANGVTGGGNTLTCGGPGGDGRTTSRAGNAPPSSLSGSHCYWGNGGLNSDSNNVFSGGGGGAYRTSDGMYNGGRGGRGRVYVYWVDFPVVSSITRADTNPAKAYSYVRWTVTFSKPVTGVDVSDFTVTRSGGTLNDFAITEVSGSGKVWTVTAFTGNTGSASSGKMRLNLLDDNSIREEGTGMYLSGDANRGSGGKTNAAQNGSSSYEYTINASRPILEKKAVNSPAMLDGIGSFNLVVRNASTTTMSNVVVTDTLPGGSPVSMEYLSHSADNGTATVSGQTVTWTIPDLQAGQTAHMTLNGRMNRSGLLTNTLSVPGASTSATLQVLRSVARHYRMDEMAGTWDGTPGEVIDSNSLNPRPGFLEVDSSPTETNVVTPASKIVDQPKGDYSPPPPVTVQNGFCNAGNFDGKGHVRVPDPQFNYGDTMSVSAWIYPTAYPTNGLMTIISNSENFTLSLNTSKKLKWQWNSIYGGKLYTHEKVESSSVIPLNKWSHIAITFNIASNPTHQRIYVNGIQQFNGDFLGTLLLNDCDFFIGTSVSVNGCTPLPEQNFQGMIDEVKLYDYELTQQEVQEDMAYGRQCKEAFDHIRIEHDGKGRVCEAEPVTIKACMDEECSTLYGGIVSLKLLPSGWVGGDSFSFSGGMTTRQFKSNSTGTISVMLEADSVVPAATNPVQCRIDGKDICEIDFASCNYSFDAVEPGGAPQTNLFTKLAGVPFNVDVLALDSPTTVNPIYTGTLSVDLIDAQGADCPDGAGLTPVQNVAYEDELGRKNIQFSYPGAARKVRVRIREDSGIGMACSTDSFAIRPQALFVSSSANADATGTNASATPTFRAGTAFMLFADSGTAGYDGQPKANGLLLEWPGVPAGGRAAPGVGRLEGVAGNLTFTTAAQAGSGNGASGEFIYEETGYFRFKADGIYDDTFVMASGDYANGDCIVNSSSTALNGGKYGCSVGSAASEHFGRFIPDHFDTTVEQGCARGEFTYSGQPFSMTVTARNALTASTQNYAGAFARNVTLSARDAADTQDNPGPGTLNITAMPSANFQLGVGSLSQKYTFTSKQTPPTEIRLRASDGEASSLVIPVMFSTEGQTVVRSGRTSLMNGYGSEQLDLPFAFRVEYFNGTGWQKNTQDSCTGDTALSDDNKVSLTLTRTSGLLNACVRDGGNPGLSGVGCTVSAPETKRFLKGTTPPQGFTGDFNLWLEAPGAGQVGSMKINAAMPPWLGDVSATATFGRYKSPVIYRRENY